MSRRRLDHVSALCRVIAVDRLLTVMLVVGGSQRLHAQGIPPWQAGLGIGIERSHAEYVVVGEIGRLIYATSRARLGVVFSASRLSTGNLVCLAGSNTQCDLRELANVAELGVAASVSLSTAQTTPFLEASVGPWRGHSSAVATGEQSGESGAMFAAEAGYRIRRVELGVTAHRLDGSASGVDYVTNLVFRALF